MPSVTSSPAGAAATCGRGLSCRPRRSPSRPSSVAGFETCVDLGLSPLGLGGAAILGFAWLVVEVGLVEEFFFRALVQERASAFFRSKAAGVVIMALVFGLAHAPGLYLRTGATQEGLSANPTLLAAVGYSLVVTSVAGLFFGVLWARTRNLALVCLCTRPSISFPTSPPGCVPIGLG